MQYEVTVPMFAEGATKIKIRQWLFSEGKEVKTGDNLVEATTDKIAIYIEAPHDGYLESIKVEENQEIWVGQVIAIISSEKMGG